MSSNVNPELLEWLNAVRVTKRDLEKVVQESEKRHSEGTAQDGEGIYLVASLFRNAKPQKAQAVYFRMLALARIIGSRNAPGWTQPQAEDGTVLTSQALIDAAATCPLIEVNGDVGFDREALVEKALELAKPEGRA